MRRSLSELAHRVGINPRGAIVSIVVRRAGTLVVGLMLLLCGTARAGTYEVWSCADANGKPIVADGWRSEGAAQFSSPSNDCANGNGLHAGLNGELPHGANTENLAWHFQVPQALKISAYRLWRAARVEPNTGNASPLYYMARQANAYVGAYVVGSENCPGWQCRGLGDINNHFAAANLVAESNLADVRDLWLNAGCGGSAGTACAAETGTDPEAVYFRMYRAAITLQDDADPTFTSPPSGTLNAGGVLSGSAGVSFSAADVGGGVARAAIEVDGVQVADQVVCTAPYTAVQPCKPAASLSLTLNTATLADGQHSVRVLVADATHSNTAVFGPFTITTANTPTTCSATAAGPAVAFDRKRSTIAYGGKLNVLGETSPGAQVRVFSTIARAGAPERLGRTPLVADATGKFTYKVPAGPSRSLRFAVQSGPAYSCSKALNVAVKARTTLKASPRTIRPGQRVRFSGKLKGGYVPKGGKLIELQAHERGRWRSITTLRTNSKGAFSYRYRFSFRAAGTTFPVRVRIRRDASYPFALGTSSRVRVRVR
jgi:hypothetical protein